MDGFININKPKDFTSHDVVNVIKRNFRGEKIGHGGTLDPAATGVLPICLGKATKLQSYVMGLTKVYCADIIFGYDSPTLDMDGEYEFIDPDFLLEEDKLSQVLQQFTGEISQIPPMVSAIKKDGVPLYKLAQKGVEIPREPREITIYSIVLLHMEKAPLPKITVKITCSKGTYIRALARDIGEAMGTCAIVGTLQRVATGQFLLENSVSLEDVAAMAEKGDYSFIEPMETVLTELPKITLTDGKDIRRVLAGNPVKAAIEQSQAVIGDANGILYALGEKTDDDTVKPFKILYEKKKRKTPMAIWKSWEDVEIEGEKTAVALGDFDGVHLGHEYLMDYLVRTTEKENLKTVIVTFSPHPREYFCGEKHKYLQTKNDKIKHIEKTGADAVFFMPFDKDLAEMTPETFVRKILVEKLHTKKVLVGYNFKFGKDAQGDGAWLKEYGETCGIEVKILDKITYDGEGISSSVIKKYLSEGNINKVNGMLGYAYQCHGEVVYGNQLGRTIGFPTANVAVSDKVLLPANGIYITWAKYGGKRHPSVTNVGNRPTIGKDLAVTVEVHILDDAPNLYGKDLEVTFLTAIRKEEAFESLEALKIKIAEDAALAQSFFSRRGEKK